MDYEISFSGQFAYRGDTGLPNHFHPDYQIQLVCAGSGVAHVNGVEYQLRKGTIILVPKWSTHDFHTNAETGMKTVELKFKSEDERMHDLVARLEICSKDDGSVFALISHIVREGLRKAPFYREMSHALVMECLVLMFRQQHNVQAARESPAEKLPESPLPDAVKERLRVCRGGSDGPASPLDFVDDFLAQNMNQKLTPAIVAAGCGYNQDYLYRVIRQKTGDSTIRYISRKKIERAKEMIMYTELSISEIAWNLGFETVQYFSRLFREVTGMAPSEYSHQMRATIRTDYDPMESMEDEHDVVSG